jgi:hypothetical protein
MEKRSVKQVDFRSADFFFADSAPGRAMKLERSEPGRCAALQNEVDASNTPDQIMR